MKTTISTLALASILALSGCGSEAPEKANDTPSIVAAEPIVPDGFFLAEQPGNAVPLSEARAAAKTGEDIVFTGYIGGREAPFTESRAVFLVADSEKAPACGDECETPWDACCVSSEEIAANSATVQIVDADGKTLHLNMNGQNGLAPGTQVAVVGTVREANDAVLIVDAKGMFAAEAAN